MMTLRTALALPGFTMMAPTEYPSGHSTLLLRPSTRIDTFTVSMPELDNRTRTIRVHLPRGYDASTASYPVLYLQDGQQLFEPGSFGDWLVDESMDRLEDTGRLAGLIIVGIDHSDRRWDEYSPWVNRQMHAWVPTDWARPTQGGEGEAYVRFLAETLKPAVDRRYRTLPGREHTGVGGSSMGGLIALFAGLARPDVFSRVMAMSTAVWFAEDGGPWLSKNRLTSYVSAHAPKSGSRIYLDVGEQERSREQDPDVLDAAGRPVTYPRAYAEGTSRVASALLAGGMSPDDLHLVIDPAGIHHEQAWARRLSDAVVWLFQ